MSELNFEILCANSSLAKGRVERANRSRQDRLVEERRLAGIGDIEVANAFLTGFIARHNLRFDQLPARRENLHQPVNLPASRLNDILYIREQRQVGASLGLSGRFAHDPKAAPPFYAGRCKDNVRNFGCDETPRSPSPEWFVFRRAINSALRTR